MVRGTVEENRRRSGIFERNRGKHSLNPSFTGFDPMYGPAVRCKRFRRLGGCGLALLYPASDWSVRSGPSWISARIRPDSRISLERASWVTSVRTRREDRLLHRRLILPQTSAGNSREARSSIISLLHAVPLFVPGGRSFVPTCGLRRAARKGGQGWPSR